MSETFLLWTNKAVRSNPYLRRVWRINYSPQRKRVVYAEIRREVPMFLSEILRESKSGLTLPKIFTRRHGFMSNSQDIRSGIEF